jgi:DNA (cytosine-5)-methyltransferase 1
MKALDFFCGAGGLTRGLLDAGVKVVAGFDLDERCKVSYEHNNPGARFVGRDIRQIGLPELQKELGTRDFREALFAGCAPCQPFSQQNKGDETDHDATLLGEFGRLVAIARPRLVLAENVPGMAKVSGFSSFRRFLAVLERNGYRYVFGVLDAKEYGVPQTRRRLVLIASRTGPVSLPAPKYGRSRRPFRSVRHAIRHLPPVGAGQSVTGVPNHVAAALTELNLERLRHTPRDGGDRRAWPKRLRLECHDGDYEGHTDVYGRMAWDAPAPTLTGRCHSISNGRYGHPTQNRAISLREAAALQSFPDRYEFFGSNKHIALQIGNAVPVQLARELGKHLLRLATGSSNPQRPTKRK